ncbi:MAG: FIST C-terminal domain-containing protein [Candidatus Omnitrophica bacterium]|nr:FIST C-terminal domain-containing protein [Candidatus Omnitrophota bacterium]
MSIHIGIGVSALKDPIEAAKDAVGQARVNLRSSKADLAIVFSSVEFAHPAVLKTIRSLSGSAQIIGSSTLAVLSDKGIHKHAIAILLLSFPDTVYYNSACVNNVGLPSGTRSGQDLADKLLYGFKNIRRDLGVIFSDGLKAQGSDLINGLQERLGSSFPLAGASASDSLAFKKTYQYYGEEVFSNSACGVIWGGKFNFGLGIKHGWKPLGKPRIVTKSSGNIVHEIDAEPAVKVYQEYFSFDLSRLKKELRLISILYPIGLRIPGEKEYLLRNLLTIEDNGSIVCQGNVPVGSSIRLMIGTRESCLEATRLAALEAKRSMAGKNINFVLVFDSVSRYILLGRRAIEELAIIKEYFKDTPVFGLYTYGEQAPLQSVNYYGKAYFHNQSVAILAAGGQI